jgi:hypothetical protein
MGLVHVGAQRESFWGTWKTDHTNLRAPLSIASIRVAGWGDGSVSVPRFCSSKKRGMYVPTVGCLHASYELLKLYHHYIYYRARVAECRGKVFFFAYRLISN